MWMWTILINSKPNETMQNIAKGDRKISKNQELVNISGKASTPSHRERHTAHKNFTIIAVPCTSTRVAASLRLWLLVTHRQQQCTCSKIEENWVRSTTTTCNTIHNKGESLRLNKSSRVLFIIRFRSGQCLLVNVPKLGIRSFETVTIKDRFWCRKLFELICGHGLLGVF